MLSGLARDVFDSDALNLRGLVRREMDLKTPL